MDKLQQHELEEAKTTDSFEVKDNDTATWALRKIRAFQEEMNEVNEISQKEIDRIKEWQAKENESNQQSIEYFEGLLMKYMIESEKKSVKLPYGTIRFKKQQPEYKRDDEKVMQLVDESYVKVMKSLDWAGLKKKLKFKGGKAIDKETGEVIEGIEVIDRPDKFEVKLND